MSSLLRCAYRLWPRRRKSGDRIGGIGVGPGLRKGASSASACATSVSRERFVELRARLGVQSVESRAVYLLAIGAGDRRSESRGTRERPRAKRPRRCAARGHQKIAQTAQRSELRRSEESRQAVGRRIGNTGFEFREVFRSGTARRLVPCVGLRGIPGAD